MMYREYFPKRSPSSGFTLMEMMIAMALIGMAMTIAFSALRVASRSWERTHELAAELDELRVAGNVIRRQLSQVMAIRPDESKRDLLFQGGSQSVEFVAPSPVQDGRLAALYRFRLRFASEEQGKALLLEYRPYLTGQDQGWQGEVKSSRLVSGLQGGHFSYLTVADTQQENAWRGLWDKPEQLPQMIRLELQLSGHREPWPALVALLPASGSGR